MDMRVFWAVFAALTAFAVLAFLALIFFAAAGQQVLDMRAQSALDQLNRQTSAAAIRDRVLRDRAQSQRDAQLLARSVCRSGFAYIARRSGEVTYYDPVVIAGRQAPCQ